MSSLVEDVAGPGIVARHEAVGAELLLGCFPDEIPEPIRLDVAAKRYLCRRHPEYTQGMNAAELEAYRKRIERSLIPQSGSVPA